MSTQVQESFGFDFAEDQAENTADGILGERRLKEEFIRSYKPTATGATRADAVLRASATISRRTIFPKALLGSSVAPDVACPARKIDD